MYLHKSMDEVVAEANAKLDDYKAKITELDKTKKALEQRVAVDEMRFPARETAIGSMLDAYLRQAAELDDHAVHLLFAANRWEAASAIEAALAAGTTLIVDRYSYSGMAFTAAKGYSLEWCAAPEIGLPKPDSIIYMDLSIEDAAKRGGYGGERYEKEEFQRIVRGIFEDMAAADPETWFRCDAARESETITKELVAHVQGVVANVADAPIARMA
ncbi:thymidylate kinase [Thecamonas trahens ATCC 50062]|uniref:dTMP kinase n=1 Tax=Thecamonas trahens ATCC 50062 TaxID=461836 RepID=A0A0L0DWX9_THETB|nr:thymidylate kinase [Thecamonas trahens ATCC 50062]KNC56048.1 thymidylate kinase [Thecamonas trahens ATCC 50062]|eukprot:XP_013761092.1 thymidylate kinase [Thecamonas trahens ATCC 50062]